MHTTYAARCQVRFIEICAGHFHDSDGAEILSGLKGALYRCEPLDWFSNVCQGFKITSGVAINPLP